jgi:ribosomal protein L1
MGKISRRVGQSRPHSTLSLEDSLRLVKDTARAKFDETVEMAIRLEWIRDRRIKIFAAREFAARHG